MRKKIHNKWFCARCIKRKIVHNDKKFLFYEMKTSPASVIFNKIIVTKEFFKTYSFEEQIAILYHEEYHRLSLTLLKRIYSIFRFLFNFTKINHKEEYSADEYAAKMVGKDIVKSFLRKSENLYKKGLVVHNPKSHPTIIDRLKNIEKLNDMGD